MAHQLQTIEAADELERLTSELEEARKGAALDRMARDADELGLDF